MNSFSSRLIKWHKKHGRHDLPWQQQPAPYPVWISEIMLQQTQVNTVIPYYLRFMQAFPEITNLAKADIDEVLHLWSGLGYYARARNIHKSAQIIHNIYQGKFPSTYEQLIALPGIGRSTAGAILAMAYNQPFPILDGNVKRVLSRYHAIEGWPGHRQIEDKLWSMAIKHLPGIEVADYTQAIMDLGATLCVKQAPRCNVCPVQHDCMAYNAGTQSNYPSPRPKKLLPLRKTVFILLENKEGKILLERRPATGIWGGLWCFPEISVKGIMNESLRKKYQIQVTIKDTLQTFVHTFTHFQLEIRPVRVYLNSGEDSLIGKDNLCWYDPFEENKLGLPSPVQKLITKTFIMENDRGVIDTLHQTG